MGISQIQIRPSTSLQVSGETGANQITGIPSSAPRAPTLEKVE